MKGGGRKGGKRENKEKDFFFPKENRDAREAHQKKGETKERGA